MPDNNTDPRKLPTTVLGLSREEAVNFSDGYYQKLGIQVRPSDPSAKSITLKRWPRKRRLTRWRIAGLFSRGRLFGVCGVWGTGPRNLADVEAETPLGARALELWIPWSPISWGSPNNPGSHRLIRVAGTPAHIKSRKLMGPKGRVVIELRADGAQSILPPSWHPCGQQYQFSTYDLAKPIPELPYDTLLQSCEEAAAAVLIAEQYPQLTADRTRHHMMLALAGVLLRSGRSPDTCIGFVIRLVELAGDDEVGDRIACVHSTFEARKAGQHTTGIPTFGEYLGPDVVQAVVKLLHVPGRAVDEVTPPLEPPVQTTTFIGPDDVADPPGQELDARSPQPPASSIVGTRLSKVTSRQVQWLWRGWIPLRKIAIVDGDPDLGKSTMSLDLAARVTTGKPMPDESQSDLRGPAGVVILTAEDDLDDTVRPRADALGADVDRIYCLQGKRGEYGERAVTLADIEEIRQAIAEVDAKLVIIDPLMAYFPLTTDSYKDQHARSILAPLKKLAADTEVAILVIRHLTKSGGPNPLYRGGGSIGIIGAVRSGMMVAPDPEDQTGERRILASTKSNLSKKPASIAYRFSVNGEVATLVWDGPSSYTAKSLLAQPKEEEPPEDRNAAEDAGNFLSGELAGGRRLYQELLAEAKKAGISEITLRRAKAQLGVQSQKSETEDGPWYWGFPNSEGQVPPPPEDTSLFPPEDDQPRFEDDQKGPSPGDDHLRADACGKGLPDKGFVEDDHIQERGKHDHLRTADDHLQEEPQDSLSSPPDDEPPHPPEGDHPHVEDDQNLPFAGDDHLQPEIGSTGLSDNFDVEDDHVRERVENDHLQKADDRLQEPGKIPNGEVSGEPAPPLILDGTPPKPRRRRQVVHPRPKPVWTPDPQDPRPVLPDTQDPIPDQIPPGALLAVDTEVLGKGKAPPPWQPGASLVCVGFAVQANGAIRRFACPVSDRETTQRWLGSANPKAFHNSGYDVSWLLAQGFAIAGVIHDTSWVAAFENGVAAKGLKQLGPYQYATHYPKTTDNLDLVYSYCANDAQNTLGLYHPDSPWLAHPLYTLYSRLVVKLAQVSLRGMPIFPDRLEAAYARIRQEHDAHLTVLETFAKINWQSQPQVAKVLAPLLPRVLTPTGRQCVAKSVLRKCTDPIALVLRAFGRARWRLAMYLEDFLGQDRLRGFLSLGGASTGRTSSSQSNLQDVPHDLRTIYGSPTHDLVKIDVSSAELAVAAMITQCQALLAAFQAGRDPHRDAASFLFSVPYDNMPKELRDKGKIGNYSMIYGGTEVSLIEAAEDAGLTMSLEEAQRLIARRQHLYPEIVAWQNDIRRRFWRGEVITSAYGRQWKRSAEMTNWRSVLAAPISSVASDLLLLGVDRVWERLERVGTIVNLVHDEVDLLIPKGAWPDVEGEIQDITSLMAEIDPRFPMLIEVGVGPDWGSTSHKFTVGRWAR